jgi:hypothetical protein
MEAKMPAAYAKKSHFVAYWKTRYEELMLISSSVSTKTVLVPFFGGLPILYGTHQVIFKRGYPLRATLWLLLHWHGSGAIANRDLLRLYR